MTLLLSGAALAAPNDPLVSIDAKRSAKMTFDDKFGTGRGGGPGGGPSAVGFGTDQWRCDHCRKLLGKTKGSQIHILRKPAEFFASFPVTAKCPGCGRLNTKENC